MKINEAKEQIKNAIKAYFTKDEFGNYKIPIERQRPVFLMGPPGVGKTAIMEQIASEMGVGLVSYSMTHHTRQSALGLPFIDKKIYDGKEYSVSEYTMSEIIASVYDMMENTGVKEGILFLDEINCVSETLAPAMLQFLQYKVFGRHRVRDGWIVVTAGNPPEYNSSVREFDIVTWDRLKRIDIEPDYDAWKEYAYKTSTHPAVTTYLNIRKSDFYKIETTIDGKSFVTARGWSDLSDMMNLYEENNIEIDEKLISQYIQDKKIARDFSIYYDLFNKYRSDYKIDKILSGEVSEEVKTRAQSAKFDEKLSLLGLIINAVTGELKSVCLSEMALSELFKVLKNIKSEMNDKDILICIDNQAEIIDKKISTGKISSSLSADEIYSLNSVNMALENIKKLLLEKQYEDNNEAFAYVKEYFNSLTKALRENSSEAGKKLSNVFIFCDEVFKDGQEMLILVTELTVSYYGSKFISRYGCKEYFEHNKELLFYERQKEIISEIENLNLD